MLVISLSYFSVQILQRMDISALLPDSNDQRIGVVAVYIMTTLQHFSNITHPNILVDVAFGGGKIGEVGELSAIR